MEDLRHFAWRADLGSADGILERIANGYAGTRPTRRPGSEPLIADRFVGGATAGDPAT
jgi:hypothetical protein